MRRFAPHLLAGLVACGASGCSPALDRDLDIKFDPCAVAVRPAEGSSAAHKQSVQQALQLWDRVAALGLLAASVASATEAVASARLDPAATRVPVLVVAFQAAPHAFRGVYDDEHGRVFVNDALAGNARVLTIAHELGHAFGLDHVSPHVSPSVMNPGIVQVRPTPEDGGRLHAVWGECTVAG